MAAIVWHSGHQLSGPNLFLKQHVMVALGFVVFLHGELIQGFTASKPAQNGSCLQKTFRSYKLTLWGTTMEEDAADEVPAHDRRSGSYDSGQYDYAGWKAAYSTGDEDGEEWQDPAQDRRSGTYYSGQYDYPGWNAAYSTEDEDFEKWQDKMNANGKGFPIQLNSGMGEDGKLSVQDNEDVSSSMQDQLDLLNQRLNEQQDQIERLIRSVESLSQGIKFSDSKEGVSIKLGTNPIVPIKAMLFIDGTWLYYSLYEREFGRCPIRQKYGHGWNQKYNINWSIVPKVICEALQDRGWSSIKQPRPMEITRACVFTSYRADTLSTSPRFQLFEDLKASNYDVHQMETVGKSEKCVDIQLAVEMLHYATLPDAFDVAIMLTGDKDFLPALARTRQKGHKVALVSMRPGCNRALKEANGIKDFDVVWLEDHLDKIMTPKHPSEVETDELISIFTVSKVLKDFIDESGMDRVGSRDVGRYLQCLTIGNTSVLAAVKAQYGGLKGFISASNMFDMDDRDRKNDADNSQIYAYWIKLLPDAERNLLEIAKTTKFSANEKDFFSNYDKNILKDRETAYYHTLCDSGELIEAPVVGEISTIPRPVEADYSTYTVAELREQCRERGLPTTGLKSVLLERVIKDAEEEKENLRKIPSVQSSVQLTQEQKMHNQIRQSSVSPKVENYLKDVVKEILVARGGKASSREIGRYLAANKSSDGTPPPQNSALRELKNEYGGLSSFINCYPELFYRNDEFGDDRREFKVVLHGAPIEFP